MTTHLTKGGKVPLAHDFRGSVLRPWFCCSWTCVKANLMAIEATQSVVDRTQLEGQDMGRQDLAPKGTSSGTFLQ